MKEEATTKPEHPGDPRRARPQAPVRLVKGESLNQPLIQWLSSHLSQEPPLAPTSCQPQFQTQTPKMQFFVMS